MHLLTHNTENRSLCFSIYIHIRYFSVHLHNLSSINSNTLRHIFILTLCTMCKYVLICVIYVESVEMCICVYICSGTSELDVW